MARYRGPVCKFSRREGEDLELKSGMKNFDAKCKSKTPLGMGHGARPSGKPSDYQLHLRAKQKLRRYYGVLERQFRNYYRKAASGRTDTGESLLQLLEARLDNVVYRIGLGVTRAAARQMVAHGQVLVDGQRVDIPSYQVRPGQLVTLSEAARAHSRVKEAVAHAEMRELSRDWLDVNLKEFSGKVVSAPTIHDLMHLFDVSLVVEYYSK
ncbi:MAG: 30S ribosomal protein S4 [Betaproteobacteria bacterium]|nr:30S ribosomal protein S4 [Betaproteobacteria bacterium]